MLSLFGDGRNSNSKLVPNPEADCERHTRRRCERTPEAWTSREGERTPDASSVQSVVRKLRCTGLLDVLRLGGAWLVREGLRDGDAGIPSLDRTGDALARSAAALEAWRALFASARSWRPGECCTHSMTATASRESLISSHKTVQRESYHDAGSSGWRAPEHTHISPPTQRRQQAPPPLRTAQEVLGAAGVGRRVLDTVVRTVACMLYLFCIF